MTATDSFAHKLELSQAAFTVALEDFHRTYGHAYTDLSRSSLDEEGRRQAHKYALTEAFDAGLARYLRETGGRTEPVAAVEKPDSCPDCHGTGSVARSNGVFMRCGRCYGWAK